LILGSDRKGFAMAAGIVDLGIKPLNRISRKRIVLRAFALALMPDPAHASAATVTVKMGDKPPVYEPEKLTIKAGQTVEWINNGALVHSVTAVPDDATNPKDVSLPSGATTFDSGFMPPGGTFDYTFTVPGTYHYFCVPHEKAGMVGTIVVKK
jgi:plastocyanin